jgi:hypothetical protein
MGLQAVIQLTQFKMMWNWWHEWWYVPYLPYPNQSCETTRWLSGFSPIATWCLIPPTQVLWGFPSMVVPPFQDPNGWFISWKIPI